MPERLLQELTELAGATEGLGWFAERMSGLGAAAAAPHQLPVCGQIAALRTAGPDPDRLAPARPKSGRDPALPGTRPAVEALIEAIPRLRWQQSYTQADGFSRDWLDNYGWVNLVSPEGLFLSNEMRISIGYWGAGQHYDEHSHAPEETYLILAGGARFFTQGRAPRDAGAGETVHHAPHQKHSMTMTPGPLLAAAFWRGEDLLKKSDLGRDVR